jgi:antimicrobial peptide system SdpB family protein
MFRIKSIIDNCVEYISAFELQRRNYSIVRLLLAAALFNDIILVPSDALTLPYKHSLSLFALLNGTTSKTLAIIILIFYVTGRYQIIASILFFWVCYSLRCAAYFANGGNCLIVTLALLMIPLSFLSSKKSSDNQVRFVINCFSVLSIVTIQLQITIVYFFSAWSKLFDHTWRNGTAMFYWANEPYTGWPDWMSGFKNYFFATSFLPLTVGWSVIIFEFILAFAFMFSERIKNKLLIAAIAFHSMLAVFHGLVSFSIIMAAALILYLLPMNKNAAKSISYN